MDGELVEGKDGEVVRAQKKDYPYLDSWDWGVQPKEMILTINTSDLEPQVAEFLGLGRVLSGIKDFDEVIPAPDNGGLLYDPEVDDVQPSSIVEGKQ